MASTNNNNFRGNTALLQPHKFKTIAIEAVNDPDPEQKILSTIDQHDVKDCRVKIIYSITPEHANLVNIAKIQEKLAKTSFCSITPVLIQNPSRTNLPEVNATYYKSPLKALDKYLDQRPDLNKQSLLTKAQLLLGEMV